MRNLFAYAPVQSDLLLSCQVLEGKDEAPVEVALPCEGAVVDVCGLGVLGTLQPAEAKTEQSP
jgi:hypothetical protein